MDKIFTVSKRKFENNMMEDYILKYTWSDLGHSFVSTPISMSSFTPNKIHSNEQYNMKCLIVKKKLMLSLAVAASRLVHSIENISQLKQCTSRIFTL